MWRGFSLACLLLCTCQASTPPLFMVTFPEMIIEGIESKLCATLLHPNETLRLSVSLVSGQDRRLLLEETTAQGFYRCEHFQGPLVPSDSMEVVEVQLQGESFTMEKRSEVHFRPSRSLIFIQTDKPIYKPGQTVHFRIVSLNENFVPVNDVYDVVELRDPARNRISQWLEQTSNGSILQLSLPLNPEARLGTYTLAVLEKGSTRVSQHFKVKEFVLPKFEVETHLPDSIFILDTEVTAKICGKYTYGKPVSGTAKLELCRKRSQYQHDVIDNVTICRTVIDETDKTGCFSYTFNVTEFMQNEGQLENRLRLYGELEEHGTGVVRRGGVDTRFTHLLGKVEFLDTAKHYEQGIPLQGKIRVVRHDSSPVANHRVYVTSERSWPHEILLNDTTDSQGIVHFSFNTSQWTRSTIWLEAKSSTSPQDLWAPGYEKGSHSVTRSDKPSSSFISIQKIDQTLQCGTQVAIRAQYSFFQKDIEADVGSIDFYYLVVSRGAISISGHMVEPLLAGSVKEGEVSFILPVSHELSPQAHVLVYAVLPNERVLAHSSDFQVEKCFRHKVSLKFASPQSVPGADTAVHLSAHPGSLCALKAIDRSVLLVEPEQELTAKIYDSQPIIAVTYNNPYYYDKPKDCLPVRVKKRSYIIHDLDSQRNAKTTFNHLRIRTITNMFLQKPDCLLFKGWTFYNQQYREYGWHGGRLLSPSIERLMMSPQPIPVVETVRTFFPETWLWDLVPVGESGSAQVPVTVPDTITTWEAGAFCLSPIGLGLAPSVRLTTFQPFFVELTLPYSIIRGERFELKATVFNYMSKCIMVKVSPAPSSDFTLEPCPGCEYSSCLCASQGKTFRWTLVASVLGAVNVSVSAEAVQTEMICDNEVVSVPEQGRIDTVIQTLLVEAEGTEKTISYNWLLCPKGSLVKEEVQLQLPEDIVEGSARASLSVLGDLLGRALQNLDRLLAMPYGCGEQNMVLFAPNIYILKYLESTGQLTQEIRNRATEFLKSGYQRQLNYMRFDGSYSAFGNSDDSGNTWLTAFVMKSFGGAQSYIYIDPNIISSTMNWLTRHQQPNGCFQSVGRLFNNRMKGGVSDEVTLTAYVSAAMLELNMSRTDQVLNSSLSCLRSATQNLTNIYTAALLFYTFTLARDEDTRAQLWTELETLASREGDTLHWPQSASEGSDSLSVEMSSYVLLALLSHPPLSASDLGRASKIVSWLTKQQNSYGGFSSTQDTVVALQALSLYGAEAFSKEVSSQVTAQSTEGDLHQFTVDSSNSLLYQERALRDVPGKYSVEVQGTGCMSIQVALHYNIPPPPDFSTFQIAAESQMTCDSGTRSRPLTAVVNVSYKGQRESTNMVIVNVKLLSGFVFDKDTLNELKGAPYVKRVDTEDGHVIVYLDGLHREKSQQYRFRMIQEHPVKGLKPAVVKIYDYYQTSEQATSEYTYPCPEEDHETNQI
nr:PREDICTED: alpha-2-macroglobulin-like [Lepisosteus oculatus]